MLKIGEVSERIAVNVKRLRAEFGLSQSDLVFRARVAGKKLSPSALSEIERGVARPSVGILEAIATGLDVDIARLFEDSQPRNPPKSLAKRRQAKRRVRQTSRMGARQRPFVTAGAA